MNFVKSLTIALIVISSLSCSKDDEVKSPAKAVTSFLVGDDAQLVEGTIDSKAMTITLTMPESRNITALVPRIEISDKASVKPASGAKQNFTKPVKYTVTAEDGSQQVYTVSVARVPVENAEILTFSLNDHKPVVEAIIDQDQSKVSFVLPGS